MCKVNSYDLVFHIYIFTHTHVHMYTIFIYTSEGKRTAWTGCKSSQGSTAWRPQSTSYPTTGNYLPSGTCWQCQAGGSVLGQRRERAGHAAPQGHYVSVIGEMPSAESSPTNRLLVNLQDVIDGESMEAFGNSVVARITQFTS
jgi:hypothetical protein